MEFLLKIGGNIVGIFVVGRGDDEISFYDVYIESKVTCYIYIYIIASN